jgi:hypothetical protein
VKTLPGDSEPYPGNFYTIHDKERIVIPGVDENIRKERGSI